MGHFQTFSKDYDARAVRIPLAAAQDLLATTGVNTLVVSLKQTQDTEPMAAKLAQKYAGQGLEVKTWLKLNDFYAKTVKMYDVQFGVLRIIILLMVLLSVVNSVNMSVFERVGEFGTMMALGNRSRRVFTLIIAENASSDWLALSPVSYWVSCLLLLFQPLAFPCRRRPMQT